MKDVTILKPIAPLNLLVLALAALIAPFAAMADDDWHGFGNVYLAAGIARTAGPVEGDFYAVGGQITIDHPVQGDVFAAGGRVTVAIDGKVALAGGNVEIAGTLERGGRVLADRLVISGRVGGGLRIIASRIEIAAGAKIEGPIHFTSRRAPVIAPGAEVQGPVTAMPSRAPERTAEVRRTGEWAVPLFYAGLWAAGILLLLIFPGFTVAAQDRVRAAPWQSLALGAALVFALPVVVLLLIVTVVGIPVAFALIALYAVLLLAGFLTALFFVAERIGRLLRGGRSPGTGWRVGLLLAALVLMALVSRLPMAGGLVALLVLLFGVGALGLQLYRQYADRRPAAA
jgi:cytoskeletal protein CcmA (bactofilin family)